MRAWGQRFEYLIQVLIIYSILSHLVELEFFVRPATETMQPQTPAFFIWSERFVVLVFTIEYFVRWAFASNPAKYPFTFAAIIDLLAVLPFYLGSVIDLRGLRIVRILRLLRLLKIYRYNVALQSFVHSFHLVARQLQVIGVLVLFIIIVSSTAIYEVESTVQPDKFNRFSDAVWWCITTLTTVGYGDRYPETQVGRIIATFTVIFGLGIFGTFVSLIGSAFVTSIQEERKEQVQLTKPVYEKLRELVLARKETPSQDVLDRYANQAVEQCLLSLEQIHAPSGEAPPA